MPSPSREQDALAALERLLRREILTLEQAQATARLITGNPAEAFPPQAAPEAPVRTEDGVAKPATDPPASETPAPDTPSPETRAPETPAPESE